MSTRPNLLKIVSLSMFGVNSNSRTILQTKSVCFPLENVWKGFKNGENFVDGETRGVHGCFGIVVGDHPDLLGVTLLRLSAPTIPANAAGRFHKFHA